MTINEVHFSQNTRNVMRAQQPCCQIHWTSFLENNIDSSLSQILRQRAAVLENHIHKCIYIHACIYICMEDCYVYTCMDGMEVHSPQNRKIRQVVLGNHPSFDI